jgi:hypothetical protein
MKAIKIFLMIIFMYSIIFSGILKVPSEYLSIQSAIDAANIFDSILVADGSYNENLKIEGKSITIISENGFNSTTINGSYNGSVIKLTDNSILILDGFNITEGSGEWLDLNGNTMFTYYGGGIVSDNSLLSVMNCKFSNNISGYYNENQNGTGYGGAAVIYKSDAQFSNCRFENNKAWAGENYGGGYGGAIYVWTDCQVDFKNCEFYNNKAAYFGGAISFSGTDGAASGVVAANFERCSFVNNYSGTGSIPLVGSGGAIHSDYFVNQIYANCTFVSNDCDYYGPAIYARRASRMIFVNTLMWNNGEFPIEFDGTFEPNSIAAEYSNFEFGETSIKTNGNTNVHFQNNISDDPKLVNPEITYEIQTGSPCIDAGVSSFTYNNQEIINYSEFEYSGTAPDIGAFEFGFTVDVREDILPSSFQLYQNYPNPFNPSTKISFLIPANELVSVSIYDILGNEVANLLNKEMESGFHSLTWNATELSSGVYFCLLKAGNYKITRKMLLVK